MDYKGSKILYIDYRGLNEEEGIRNIEAQAQLMKTLQEKVLVLGNYEGTYATNKFLDVAKRLGKEIIEQKTKKGPLISCRQLLYSVYWSFFYRLLLL
jgi:hypothetical protein